MSHTSASRARWTNAARSAVLDRWTLLCNHVLRAEPAATDRLAVHAGRVVCFETTPPPMPVLPSWLPNLVPDVGPVCWAITAAGLIERVPDVAMPGASSSAGGAAEASTRGPTRADVTIVLRPAAPWDHARAFATGGNGMFEVRGDESVAADVRWVVDNVRWDVAGDVERLLPAPLQAPAAKVVGAVANGLRRGAHALEAWWPRSGDRSSSR